jgi:hypothetical protein
MNDDRVAGLMLGMFLILLVCVPFWTLVLYLIGVL